MWEKIKKFVCKHVILSVFILSAFFITAISLFGMSLLRITPPYEKAIYTVGQLVLTVIIIWLMRKLQVFNINDFKFRHMGNLFLLAWVGIVDAVITFFINFTQIPENGLIAPNPLHLLIVILHPLIGTALFEEVLYRGLVLKLLLAKMGYSKKGIIGSCIISSVLFGIGHVSNIIAFGGDILPFVSQIIYCIAWGIFFAALFLRTKTLWIPIIIHALSNLSVQIFGVIISPAILLQSAEAQGNTDILGFIVLTLIKTLPALIAGLVLLRKAKPENKENSISQRGMIRTT